VPFSDERAKSKNQSAGWYSAVKDVKSDPHLVRKQTLRPTHLEYDAYLTYINIVKDYAKENPFFPRVYGVTIQTDKNGDKRPSYTLEKLHRLDEADPEVVKGMAEKLFVPGSRPLLKILRFRNPGERLVEEIEQTLTSGQMGDIADPNLRDALLLIRMIAQKYKYGYDLHWDNAMVRYTPHGPQLVITDPLGDGGWSRHDLARERSTHNAGVSPPPRPVPNHYNN
jgi:hypothetical protein